MPKIEIKVDTPTCTGCRICEMVCSLYHEGVLNLEKARLWVTDNYAESLYEPHICRLCEPSHCVEVCPTGALIQDPETGTIGVSQEQCNACLACVEMCPYQAIRWSDELRKLFVCDRCQGQPLCVSLCTTEAIYSVR
ncbi:MAG: 4Fe-4S dicluster domain-containing protein [Chloroflexi bacterium]|nr:4Fe-4S dicluster domain-containing protein [Chloroflexota bacterium]